jgi:plastocyanin
MLRYFGLLVSLVVCVVMSVEAGEITGTVTLQSKSVPGRAENPNPNRQQVLKKYGMKAKGGEKGGLPKNEKVDERDFAVIYLTNEKDGAKLPASKKKVEITQKGRRFFEHVTPIVLGSSVLFTNQDKYYHHIYCPDASKLNVPQHRGEAVRKPDKLGKYELFCDIHPLMNAYVYVVPNDKFAMPKEGKFALKDVPPGKYNLNVWHPRLPATSYGVIVEASGDSKVNITL